MHKYAAREKAVPMKKGGPLQIRLCLLNEVHIRCDMSKMTTSYDAVGSALLPVEYQPWESGDVAYTQLGHWQKYKTDTNGYRMLVR